MANVKADVWDRISNQGQRIEPKEGQQIGCLIWTLSGRGGYGTTRIPGERHPVHRVSFWIHSNYTSMNDIPRKNENGDNVMVCHKCNNSLCFEPTHLQLDTELNNNNRDKLENGTLLRGEKNHQAKITETLALAIKHSKYPFGHEKYMKQKERAELFKVSEKMISCIDTCVAWAHLPDRDGIVVGSDKINDDRRKKREEARDRVWTE